MQESTYTKSDIKSLVEKCLIKENLQNITVDILGNTEKGENFISDVFFVHVTDQSAKEYDVVLKCSKKEEMVRKITPTKLFFLNEIHFYEKILPNFAQFQRDNNIENVFNADLKCFGTVVDDHQEVIALNNLQKLQYVLWDKRKPMPRKYIDFALEQYAKCHATSAAFQDQQPELYKQLTDETDKFLDLMINGSSAFIKTLEGSAQLVSDLLENELDGTVISKWKEFVKDLQSIYKSHLKNDGPGISVVLHGDPWNNNFLFQHAKDDLKSMVILDWQISCLGSPVVDLSRFLFACISQKDLKHLDDILQHYYKWFSHYLENLKSDPRKLYPLEQFLEDWRKFSKVGLCFTSFIITLCAVDKDNVRDITDSARDGISEVFKFDVKNTTLLKQRVKPIVEFAVERNII